MITEKIEDFFDRILEFLVRGKIIFILSGILGIVFSIFICVIRKQIDLGIILCFPLFGYFTNTVIFIAVYVLMHFFKIINSIIYYIGNIIEKIRTKKITIKQLLLRTSLFIILFSLFIYFINPIAKYVIYPIIKLIAFLFDIMDYLTSKNI